MKTTKKIIATFSAVILFSGIASAQSDTTIKIKTSAQCEDCQYRIEHNLSFEKGVKKVKLDLITKEVTIVYNPKKTSAEKLKTAVTKIGYDADDLPADENAYNKLPKCCQKGGHE